MNDIAMLSVATTSIISGFLDTHGIRSMTINSGTGIRKHAEISEINILFIRDRDDASQDYTASFKLQDNNADINRYLKAVNTTPEFIVNLGDHARKLDKEGLNDKILGFYTAINDRVEKLQKEQAVQNIRYVGNTFILNNSTTFKVLSDEGEGRLIIEILGKDSRQEAKLTASDLLDGLYLGSIQLV